MSVHAMVLSYALVSVLAVPYIAGFFGFNNRRPAFRGSHESQFLGWRRRHPSEDVQ